MATLLILCVSNDMALVFIPGNGQVVEDIIIFLLITLPNYMLFTLYVIYVIEKRTIVVYILQAMQDFFLYTYICFCVYSKKHIYLYMLSSTCGVQFRVLAGSCVPSHAPRPKGSPLIACSSDYFIILTVSET